ncbi:MAG: shikimate kinase [Acidobacteriota bacterium]
MHSIFLVGFMGCGKTTVGRLLAERLAWSFVDLDQRIADNEGRTIPEIFSDGGEPAFRIAERQALFETVSAANTVVAAGGGLFCDPENRRLIAGAGGWAVFLDVPWSVIKSRIGSRDPTRPMWDSHSAAKAVYDRRLGAYRMADAVVAVGTDWSAAEVAKKIVQLRPELACAL